MWWHDAWGGWWFVMPLALVAFWALVIWLVMNLFRSRRGPPPTQGAGPARPEDILAQRYARAEIDDDEDGHRPDTLRDARRLQRPAMTDTTHTTSRPDRPPCPGAGPVGVGWSRASQAAPGDRGDRGCVRLGRCRRRRRAAGPVTLQIAAARQACQQWLDDSAASQGGAGPGAGWCNDMARWMTDNMATGQMMMGPMMWSSPEAMRDVCVQAMGTGQRADATQWRDQMVAWMSQRMGDWDNWHEHGDD
jgi:putative membrane protein